VTQLLQAWSRGAGSALDKLVRVVYQGLHLRARRCMAGERVVLVAGEPDRDLVSLDDALQALATFDERKARVVEMRFFGGLSVEGTAMVLGVSPQTVLRDWKLAKVWLLREMKRGGSVTPGPEEAP
jgi:DNA-directed RNA polymerase specialized sigma24 family protein